MFVWVRIIVVFLKNKIPRKQLFYMKIGGKKCIVGHANTIMGYINYSWGYLWEKDVDIDVLNDRILLLKEKKQWKNWLQE